MLVITSSVVLLAYRSVIDTLRVPLSSIPAAMDNLGMPGNAIAFSLWVLLLILNSTEAPVFPQLMEPDADDEDPVAVLADNVEGRFHDAHNEMRAMLHHFRLCLAFNFLDEDIGFWVKPRSTTWFSRFLLEQYDNARWVQMFRMTKPVVLALSEV